MRRCSRFPSCSREDSLDECERPHDTLSCLLFSALWLRCNYSILVQETQSAKDLDLTCFTTCMFNAVTCLPIGPMSLDWPIDPLARSDLSGSSLPPEVPSGEQELGALPVSTRSRWRQGALRTQPQILQRTTWSDGCGSSLKACDVLHGTPGARQDLFSPDKGKENLNSHISKDSWTASSLLFVSRKCMERTSFSSYPGVGSAISALWYLPT